MESSWPAQSSFSYYNQGSMQTSSRHASSPTNEYSDRTPRRSAAQPQMPAFLPPPPPHGHQLTESGGDSLPSFSHSLYSPYHGPGGNLPSSNPHGMAHSMPSYSHISALSGTGSGFQYTNHSPMGLNEPLTSHSRSQITHSYHDPPRLPGYSSSPNLHQLSPVSPTAHLLPSMQPPSASPSSSSFPSSIPRTPATLPKGVKRHSLGSEQSFDSWDDEQEMSSGKVTGDRKHEKDSQPWGMPQEEYKKLNPKDKKQVRNRIGARRFRAKRKGKLGFRPEALINNVVDYVNQLEAGIRLRDDEITNLQSQLESQRNEINELRLQLKLPLLPRGELSGLGLTMETQGQMERWENNDSMSR
ncbi:hypothetical protein C343_04692 [Cryptococcus neoformans C23]|uniref:BZIP domain-containing protein n=1 Tax=Cryptococcus neoformans Tu259-1 TaxID=1230072 RepID=A0A854Q7G1_CRYNE|nr:hypothetical protein C347_04741 [Cryptococcus neoformans var. grubii AD2-60a]OWZ37611.1 hypothetical protein C353_04594 [Cryptococcus neoformans var. grubii AD1-83a]OWZ41532.1 hypothetical protein C343_04692 [Cryptococcus neoformans var. grubii C23]OWZ52538.1 hypothetical protein C368_04766 [Cryptococcus neoformans var. grubii 125.91]OXC83275.1 hypothetical protein C344_04420 [Cryptococcus neoformans var. grubii AD1-7a]OXG16538.1 hypothetical protein C361_04907 [Cryptococcus neoformans var.